MSNVNECPVPEGYIGTWGAPKEPYNYAVWNNVIERKPEPNRHCIRKILLVTNITTGNKRVALGFFLEDGKWREDSGVQFCKSEKVTHWMDAPALP